MPINQAPKKNRASQEGMICLLLTFLIVFEILFTSVAMARTLHTTQPQESTPGGSLPSQPEDPTPEKVFSGGVIPTFSNGVIPVEMSGLTSKYAVLVDATTGELIAGKNADVRFSPASMTKVMTLIVACENLTKDDLTRRLKLTRDIVTYVSSGEYTGTSSSLPHSDEYIGDEYYIEDLLFGIGVASAADCSYMIACEVAGSEAAFVELMNAKAKVLGLTDTHFNNVIGYESAENYTTARDMAVIMAYAMQCELIASTLSMRKEQMFFNGYYQDPNTGGEKTYPVWLTSSFDSRLDKYPSFSPKTVTLEATKTGYTTESYMAVSAKGKSTGHRYVLILGEADAPASNMSGKFKDTMIDIELIFDTYAE